MLADVTASASKHCPWSCPGLLPHSPRGQCGMAMPPCLSAVPPNLPLMGTLGLLYWAAVPASGDGSKGKSCTEGELHRLVHAEPPHVVCWAGPHRAQEGDCQCRVPSQRRLNWDHLLQKRGIAQNKAEVGLPELFHSRSQSNLLCRLQVCRKLAGCLCTGTASSGSVLEHHSHMV